MSKTRNIAESYHTRSKELRATVSELRDPTEEEINKERRLSVIKCSKIPDTKTWLMAANVRICPARIILDNVYTGSSEARVFSIQNEGKHKAFVRISSLKGKDFELDGIPRGFVLKPGEKIVKTVYVLYIDASCLQWLIPIYINNERIDYHVVANLSTSKITYAPSTIDFGIIDQGGISALRTLVLTNDGFTTSTFHVDMTKSKGHIVAEPNRGILQAKSTFELKIKIIPLYSGHVEHTLVIKCEKLISIPITATAIVPKLEAIHHRALKHFTLIYFSPTYFGIKSVQRLLIRNFSAFDCMFATNGQFGDESIDIEEYSEYNPDAKEFKMSPLDGIMQPQETKIFSITFAPLYKTNARNKLFFFCTMVIHKIRCKYIQEELWSMDICSKITDGSYSYKGSVVSMGTLSSYSSHRSINFDTSFLTAAEAQAYYKSQKYSDKDKVIIHLIGEAEIPSVKVIPDELHLDNLQMQSAEIRVLELQNASRNLPIIVRYQKVPFVSVEKATICLKPLESKQIAVTVAPYKLGKISMKMVFDLMYYDQPKEGPLKVLGSVSVKITLVVKSVTNHPKPEINRGLAPNYINEVGKYCQDLRFNSSFNNLKVVTVEAKKHLDGNCKDLVALPNDARRSLRPWRSNIPCCTIFTHQPRYIQPIDRNYERSQSEQDLRERVITYYNKHIGSGQKKSKQRLPTVDDYTITPQTKTLNADIKCSIPEKEAKKIPVFPPFMPLLPTHMKRILAIPECVRTGQIAANYSVTFPIRIQNLNKFPIRLYIRSDKATVGCIRESRYIIEGHSCKVIKLIYISGSIGYYAAILYLIFNESMMLPIPLLADVVPKTLRVNTASLEFSENHTHRYIEITNYLNMAIKFCWIADFANFNVHPQDGTVEMGQIMRCIIYYYPEIEGPEQCTIKFMSGEYMSQSIMLTTTKFQRRLELISKEVNFENIPLQQFSSSFLIIKNPCNFPVAYKIDRTDLKPSWIKIFPMEATVQANCQFSLAVIVKCPKCVIFQGSIKLVVVNTTQEIDLTIRGKVIYPDMRISPTIIDFHKVVSFTHSAYEFTVTNNCPLHTHLGFEMEDYDEFSISESRNFWSYNFKKEYVFKPNEWKTFYIHFSPKETMSTWFYLPIVIDKILGPPLRYDTITQLVDYYLSEGQDLNDEHCQRISLPQRLPCLKVIAFSVQPKVVFSKTKIVFKSYRRTRKMFYVLKIKNAQQTTDVVSLKIHYLTNPFSYSIKETVSTAITESGINFTLEPQQEDELTIIYDPQTFGESNVRLPVYLKDEPTEMHTAIEIVGICQQPVIGLYQKYIDLIGVISENVNKTVINTDDDYWIYCKPLPEYTTAFTLRLGKFLYHNSNCKLSFNYVGDEEMEIGEGDDKIWSNKTDYTVTFRMTLLPQKSRIFTGCLEVSCSCGGFWSRRIIAAIENSFLTTYAFSHAYLRSLLTKVRKLAVTSSCTVQTSQSERHSVEEFWHLFPLFPSSSSEFTTFMENCIHAVEMWVYTQGFFQKTYYVIPRCINAIYMEVGGDTRRPVRQQVDIPYVRLLNNLIGPEANNYLGVGEFPSNKADQVTYTLYIFQRALNLVKEFGGTFTYNTAEFFLPFDFFEIFRKECLDISTTPRPLAHWAATIEEYTLLAKQSWLDLLLQTYKVFYLNRLPNEKKKNVTYCPPLEKFLDNLPCLDSPYCHVYSNYEHVIIAWCQYHYNDPESQIWKPKRLNKKVVSIVGNSLQDGLVFACVTFAYCPYLIYHLKTMYPYPVTVEEVTHNLHTIIQSWEMLNYSFTITSDDILKPNPIRMLMQIAYLYDVLPSMYPNETMVFEAGLSLSVTKSIKLSNPNSYPISYKPIIIPKNTIFKVNQEKVIIPPKKSVDVKIIYFAQFATEFHCTLLLSGEVRGYHYAKNKCLTLIGTPDLTYASSTITHPAHQYEVLDLDLHIQSPYTAFASYDLRQTSQVLHSYKELEATVMYSDKTRFKYGRIVIINDIFMANAEGVFPVQGIIRTLYVRDDSTFLYFSNCQVGDFMVRIDTKWYNSNKTEEIYVTLPMEFFENPKIYSERNRLTINIPLQNSLLWDATKIMINKFADEEDKPVWKSLLEMPSGRRIASRLYHTDQYFDSCAGRKENVPIDYILTTDTDCNIDLPSEVAIAGENEEGSVEIEWALKPGCRLPNNFTMTLQNLTYAKLRMYRITFLYENRS